MFAFHLIHEHGKQHEPDRFAKVRAESNLLCFNIAEERRNSNHSNSNI